MSAALAVTQPVDGVVVLTLDRPEVRNAIDVALATALVDAMAEHAEAGCIVVTGADPAFSGGLDLRNLGTDRLFDVPNFIEAIAASPVPTIAAVNGAAVTGGFELALACDFIVASERARFADTHLRVGVFPGPVVVDLPRRVGMAVAREMTLTGGFVDAARSLQIGLANHVVPHADLLPFTLELAASIASADPQAVRAVRRHWDETSALPVRAAHARHRELAIDGGFADAGSDDLRAHADRRER